MLSIILSAVLLVAGTCAQRTELKILEIGRRVPTSSGEVIGQASSWKSQVSEYLGIPFAEPPVGKLRWAGPRKIQEARGKAINATRYGL